MSETSDGFEHRARTAAAGVRRSAAVHSQDLGDLVSVSRISRVGLLVVTVAAAAAMGAIAFALATVADPIGLRWGTGAVLLVLLIATGVLSAHAGGHAWFVPVPALALAVAWAFTASARSPEAGWWLVALSATACASGAILAGTALRQRLGGTLAVLPPLRGATGVAVTDLSPLGVVRVGGENWSAQSVSGILPVGAPVHVLGVRGVRLDVWSEVGTVPDGAVFDVDASNLVGKEEERP